MYIKLIQIYEYHIEKLQITATKLDNEKEMKQNIKLFKIKFATNGHELSISDRLEK